MNSQNTDLTSWDNLYREWPTFRKALLLLQLLTFWTLSVTLFLFKNRTTDNVNNCTNIAKSNYFIHYIPINMNFQSYISHSLIVFMLTYIVGFCTTCNCAALSMFRWYMRPPSAESKRCAHSHGQNTKGQM
jgi:hypothetical protein